MTNNTHKERGGAVPFPEREGTNMCPLHGDAPARHCVTFCTCSSKPHVHTEESIKELKGLVRELNSPSKSECDCAELSCKKNCQLNHTHKGFFCEVCQPGKYEELAQAKEVAHPSLSGWDELDVLLYDFADHVTDREGYVEPKESELFQHYAKDIKDWLTTREEELWREVEKLSKDSVLFKDKKELDFPRGVMGLEDYKRGYHKAIRNVIRLLAKRRDR